MDAPAYDSHTDLEQAEDPRVATHRGIIQRLADPYLTDHDRWVLGQFACFLEGRAPGPDPRVVPARSTRPLSSRARQSSL